MIQAIASRAAASESWDIRPGQEIDRSLVVIDTLGGGSRYEVFRAWDRELSCQVAVKVVRPHRTEEDRVIEGFEREVGIAQRLDHPNLVRLLRWTLAPPRPYLVFEFISAPTLGDHLSEQESLSIPETCLLGVRMLAALSHLHSRYVHVHRHGRTARVHLLLPRRGHQRRGHGRAVQPRLRTRVLSVFRRSRRVI